MGVALLLLLLIIVAGGIRNFFHDFDEFNIEKEKQKMMGPIEKKVGQVWRARGGAEFTITEIVKENDPFIIKSGGRYWMENGRYWSNTYDHSKDLITLIK